MTRGASVRDLQINVDPPGIDPIHLADGTTVGLSFEYNFDLRGAIRETSQVRYDFGGELELTGATGHVAELRDLLTILRGTSVLPSNVDLYSRRRPGHIPRGEDNREPEKEPLELVRPLVHTASDDVDSPEYLLTAQQHPSGLAGVILGWHRTVARYRRVV